MDAGSVIGQRMEVKRQGHVAFIGSNPYVTILKIQTLRKKYWRNTYFTSNTIVTTTTAKANIQQKAS